MRCSACRKTTRFRGNPFLPAAQVRNPFPLISPFWTKFSAELRTRRKAARTLSVLNFPVCVPSIRTCRLDGTFLTVWAAHGAFHALFLLRGRQAGAARNFSNLPQFVKNNNTPCEQEIVPKRNFCTYDACTCNFVPFMVKSTSLPCFCCTTGTKLLI